MIPNGAEAFVPPPLPHRIRRFIARDILAVVNGEPIREPSAPSLGGIAPGHSRTSRASTDGRIRGLMDQVAAMEPTDRAAFEGVVLRIVSTCILQQRFGIAA